MSGPIIPAAVHEELRRRFAVWSLAIFGSLSGSGTVQLASNVWGADEPPAGSAVEDTAAPKAAEESDAPLNRDILQRMIDAKKFDEAAKRMDAALAKNGSPDAWYLNYILATNLSRVEPALAEARFATIIDGLADQLAAKPSPRNFSTFIMAAQSQALLLDRLDRTDEALQTLDKALATAENQPSTTSGLTASLDTQRARLLAKAGRADEAQTLLAQRVEEAFRKAKASPASTGLRALPAIIAAYSNLFRATQAANVERYYTDAESLLSDALQADGAGVDDYIAYQYLLIAQATELSDLDAQAALASLEKLQQRGDKFSERLDEAQRQRLLSAQATLKAATSRIRTKILHASLVGQPAPEFDIAAVVHMPRVTWPELRGKVVLLDFWAVWCGPCIATFPHLQRWSQAYGKHGLVIIGVTRKYGYAWDERLERQVPKKEATLDEEVAMLDHFRKQHELEHGFVLTPPQSEFSKKFGVLGIPQAVLVDQQGNIQLIRVGAGEKNAQELEAKIKELLGIPVDAPEKPAHSG